MQTFWSPGHQPPPRVNDRHAGSASPYGFVYISSPSHSHAQQQLYAQRVLALRPELQLLQRPLLEQQLQLQQMQIQPFQSLPPQQQMPRRIVAPGLGASLPIGAGDPMRVGSGQQLSSVGLPEGEYLPSPVALYAGSRRQHAGSAQALTSLQLSRLVPVPLPGMAGIASWPHSSSSVGPTPVPLPVAPLARPPAPSQQASQLYSRVAPPLQSPSPLSTSAFAPAPSNLVYSPSQSSQQQLQQLPAQRYAQSSTIVATSLSAPPPLVQPGQQAGQTQAATSASNPIFLVEQSQSGSSPSPSTPGAQQRPVGTCSKPGAPGQSPSPSSGGNLRPFSSASNGRAGVAREGSGGGGSSNSGTPTPSQSSALSGRSSLSSYDGVSPARGGSARGSSTTQGPPFVSSSRLNFLQLLRDGVPVLCQCSTVLCMCSK